MSMSKYFITFYRRFIVNEIKDKKLSDHLLPVHTSRYESPVFPPPSPEEIIANRSDYITKLRLRKYRIPETAPADTPLFALYRLYEFLIVDHVTGYRNQLEYFWKQSDWAVSDICDPKDDNPTRYAFLACIPALLVRCFNEKIRQGLPRNASAIISPEQAEEFRTRPESSKVYETLPEWTKYVPPLPETLVVPSHDDIVLKGLDDSRAAREFKHMNILMWGPHLHFTWADCTFMSGQLNTLSNICNLKEVVGLE